MNVSDDHKLQKQFGASLMIVMNATSLGYDTFVAQASLTIVLIEGTDIVKSDGQIARVNAP
jgi:hypothetical protein